MKKVDSQIRNASIVIVLLLLCGCAGGRNFTKPVSNSLVLGSTTPSQAQALLGEPKRTESGISNTVPTRRFVYSYASATPFTTRLSTKALVLIFAEDKLVSYDYASSFEDDREIQKVDDSAIKQIANGDSKDRVLLLLGRPTGESIYPIIVPRGNSQLLYSYIESYRIPFNPTPRISRKVVSVKFDEKDSVIDISSTESKPE